MIKLFNKLKSKGYNLLPLFIVSFSLNLGLTSFSYSLQSTTTRYTTGVVSIVQSHEYLRNHESPIYWKLSAYYLPQRNDSSCSLATAAMVVNAALAGQTISAKQPLATQNEILNRVKDKIWDEGVKEGGEGVSLAELKLLLAKALEAHGIHNFSIELIHTADNSKQNEAVLEQHLLASENNGQSIVVVNFDQSFFANDISVGHFAPVGAYDAKNKRVLIMDPDRKWYEPYWVPQKMLLNAMATLNSDGHHYRGYLVVRFNSQDQ
ncbi:phytochelatin synthase family protein [Legionella hackeliae]|uniref:glutathione gamma-glutamylcysteinyltransferase n=1 Tax=Legionella hackeliae TaxID=449 RepID=A0A0A8UUN9_LEGHA|nr:phytochelatin synthase family protein [Legionella hackeliae]KTD13799.1 Phytochelatin synthase [Legionella hackeliae]CEK10499.1 exported protein of unknown function [Legionella hackeliae]STX47237.1 Phytochelatin synthase [Legionella hackeliae]